MYSPQRFDKAQDSRSTDRQFSEILGFGGQGTQILYGLLREKGPGQVSFLGNCY